MALSPSQESRNFNYLRRRGFSDAESSNLAKLRRNHPGLAVMIKKRIRIVRRLMRRRQLPQDMAVMIITRGLTVRGFGNSISEMFRWLYAGRSSRRRRRRRSA